MKPIAIAQAMRPGARFDYRPSARWQVTGSFTLSRGEGFHTYDNAQSEVMVVVSETSAQRFRRR